MSRLAQNAGKDPRVISIRGFTLHATGMTVEGEPSFDAYSGVGDFIKRANAASGWWAADWLAYGHSRADYAAKLSQVMDVAEISEGHAKNLKYLGENVLQSCRREDVDISLHTEVAPLTPKEQKTWLAKAAEEQWTKRELRVNIRASRRRLVLEGQAKLEGVYRVQMSDCPWLYDDNGPTEDGSLGKAERHYDGMTEEQLCALPVEAHAGKDSVHFLWVPAPMLPHGLRVLAAWGFEYRTNLVWDKVLGNPGHYGLHVKHEHLLIGVRGNGQPDVPTPQWDSVLVERRSDVHSEKPESVRQWIDKHWLHGGKKLELFGREKHKGWDVYGNDARLWK